MSEHLDCTDPGRGDLLTAYEWGLLEGAERRSFEDHLAACSRCLEELYAFAPAGLAMRERTADLAAAAEAGLRSSHAGGPQRWRRALGRLLQPRILIPAVVTAAALVLMIVPTLRRDAPLSELAVLDPLPYERIEVRGARTEGARLFQQGMQAYLQRDYAGAARTLAEAAAALDRDPPAAGRPGDTVRRQAGLYLGVSLLLDGRAQAALEPLAAAATDPLPPVAERGRWYLAQAYLVCGQEVQARQALALLQDSPVYGTAATRQLQALQER